MAAWSMHTTLVYSTANATVSYPSGRAEWSVGDRVDDCNRNAELNLLVRIAKPINDGH
uniref:Uncharacterized protein n=1 Tax=Arundo donax TaxID=35708 RepID=A0A0A9H214_ARUDO